MELPNYPERPSTPSSSPSSAGSGDGKLQPGSPHEGDWTDRRFSDTSEVGYESSMAPLVQSPRTYTADYSQEQGPQSQLRARKATQVSEPPSPADFQLERPMRHAIDLSMSKALLRSTLHVSTILIASFLITLSARRVYFSDIDGFPGQDIFLQSLQYVVKAHEILMTASITDVVLHRIRWDLISAGVPFGLLSAAYQLSDLSYLKSIEFRRGFWGYQTRDRSFRRLSLGVLVGLSCFLSVFVGPSSGAVMIPRLNWWNLRDPFERTRLRLFVSNSTQETRWPSVLPNYGCAGWLCPSYGLDDIVRWGGSLQWNDAAGLVPFVNGGDNFYRWVHSNATDYGGWTVSTSAMMSMSTIIGSYWNWIDYQGLAPTVSLTQPKLSLAFADDGPIFQPLVQVQCSAYTSNHTISRNFRLPNDQLRMERANAYDKVVWPIPRVYTNLSTLDLLSYPQNLYWSKLPLSDYEHATSAGIVFVMPDEHPTKTVVPCSVLAYWIPSDLTIMPKTDRNIYNSRPNPLKMINSSYVDLSQSNQIRFSDEWWSLLINDGDPTSLDSVLHGINNGPCADDCLATYDGGIQGLAYRVSSILGMFLTDAIARYSTGGDHVVYQHPGNGSHPFAQNLGNFDPPNEAVPAGYSTWLDYAEDNPQEWREAVVTVKRQGYSWSFDGVLAKLATLVLVVQSTLALVHVVVILHGRWTSEAWSTIGTMIALALRSQRPAVPADHGMGSEAEETWAETVSVRLVERDLELHFGLPRAHTLRMIRN